jgi:hypothetical protein
MRSASLMRAPLKIFQPTRFYSKCDRGHLYHLLDVESEQARLELTVEDYPRRVRRAMAR